MAKKVLVVGGVAGGASTAARLRRLEEKTEIIIFEKGEYISFANCGLPYHISGVIEERDRLLIQTPEAMWDRFRIDVRIKNEVLAIDRVKKEVLVEDLMDNRRYRESYDYLVLSPGADPLVPPLPGLDRENVFTLRDIPDMDAIIEYVNRKETGRAAVVGGGFIGLEVAENLKELGLEVAVVEMAEQVMAPLDYEMAAFVHNHLREKGIKLYLRDGLAEVAEEQGKSVVVLQSGRKIGSDLVILGIGVRPAVRLAADAGLEMGETGAIKVDSYLKTSDESIYALGDAVEVIDPVTGRAAYVPLAGPANKQGRIAANNLAGRQEAYEGSQGTAIAKIFDLVVASTGSNEKKLRAEQLDYQVCYTTSSSHAGYYPGAKSLTIKTIFNPGDGRLLGAQIVGQKGVDKRIDLLAVGVRLGLSVYDLQKLELAYAPPFGSAKDPVNMAGYAAANIIDGLMVPALWNELEGLDDDVVLLDVRSELENKKGRIEGSSLIPLDSLRENLVGLDRKKEIVVYCAVGLRGYLACRILMEHGFERVRNLLGGYLLYSTVKHDRDETVEVPEEEVLERD